MQSTLSIRKKNTYDWIGFRENLQETIDFPLNQSNEHRTHLFIFINLASTSPTTPQVMSDGGATLARIGGGNAFGFCGKICGLWVNIYIYIVIYIHIY